MLDARAVVFPPGDAHVSRTRVPGSGRARSETSCDASSCTMNPPPSAASPRNGWPSATKKAGPQFIWGVPEPVDPQRQRGWGVIELQPLFGCLEAVALEPARHEPER